MAASYGFDTANYIYNVAASAKAKFGTGVFYLRYLNPSPAASLLTGTSGTSEFRSGWDNGVRYFAPITEPTQSRLNGTQAMGSSDAAAFCSALLSVYHGVLPLLIPSSHHLNCYLALESSTNMSAAYWKGWALYVDGYNFDGIGAILYPGMYCNPASVAKNCSSVGASGIYCYSVWSSHPEPCTACGPFGSVAWGPSNCYNGYSTRVWQMSEQGGCQTTCARGTYPNVDADMTAPSITETSEMMLLYTRP
jgi:hypothetical protein